MLEVKDLSIEYENKATVRDISFTVASGEVYSIIGKSGSGKSTILNAISGMLGRNGKVTSGTITLSGENWACGLCADPSHACRAVTLPALGALVAAVILVFACCMLFRKDPNTNRTPKKNGASG